MENTAKLTDTKALKPADIESATTKYAIHSSDSAELSFIGNGVKTTVKQSSAVFQKQYVQNHLPQCLSEKNKLKHHRSLTKTNALSKSSHCLRYGTRLLQSKQKLTSQNNTNSRSTYRQTLGYNKFIQRQAPLSGDSLSAVAFQGQRSDLTELILSVDFVYRTIEN